MSEFLPCPFCGSHQFITINAWVEDPGFGYTVCCNASGWGDRGCGASSGWGETAEEAVAAWNRRATISNSLPLTPEASTPAGEVDAPPSSPAGTNSGAQP